MERTIELYETFEQRFAEWNGLTTPVVACSSGTAALHLALEALGLPCGSTILIPDYTMIACARAAILAGLVPKFVDCRSDLLIDPDSIDEAMTDDVKAIMAVHIYGRRCDMDAIIDLAAKYSLIVVEDLAELHGVPPHTNTDAACWSMYRNKVVAGEEGGAVWFREGVVAALARSLRCLGFTDAHDFNHIPRGMNYRMSNCHARLILDSLDRVVVNVEERRRIEDWYNEECPPKYRMPGRLVPWIFDIKVNGMSSRIQDVLVVSLQKAEIPARHGFKLMSRQKEFATTKTNSPWAARYSTEIIYLPIQPGVTNRNDAKLAFEVINRALS